MPAARTNAIETDGLVKAFGELRAVDGVSIKVRQGEIFGLLGPNGAGKTTLISMLVTMKKPTSGKATVNGFDVVASADKVRESIGIVFQDQSLDEELTAYENLEMHAAMYGVPSQDWPGRIKEVLTTVELLDKKDDLVKTFSGGMRRRLEIARGLLHAPKILFLDEPTIGLDPQTRNHVLEYVKRLKEKMGMTVVLTTHYMDEADAMCDRIAIIDHGRIIALDTSEALKDMLGGDVVEIECDETEKLAAQIAKARIAKKTKVAGRTVSITVDLGERKIPTVMALAAKAGIAIRAVKLHKPTLEDVFLQFTGRVIRDESASAKDAMRIRRKAWGRGR